MLRRRFATCRAPSLRVSISDEVRQAKIDKKPIVALESTIISHGLPFPRNISVANNLEKIIRDNNAVPATIAVIKGEVMIGLNEQQLAYLAENKGKEIQKATTRDLPYILTNNLSAATTVASTMYLAHMHDIHVFATGGIGGVHRGAELTFDVSADLIELSRTPVAVVSAGIKSILDIPKSLEVLETHSVPVYGFQTNEFPAFYSNDSGININSISTARQAAELMYHSKKSLQLKNGFVFAAKNPQPIANEIINKIIIETIHEANSKNITGNAVTPFVLQRIQQLHPDSLQTNITLVENNAKIASEIAREFNDLLDSTTSATSAVLVDMKRSTPPSPSTSTTTTSSDSSSSSQSEVLVVGGAVIDIIGVVDTQLPIQLIHPQNLLKTSSPGEVRTSYGGVARNIAQQLAKLLPGSDDAGRSERVSLASVVADDLEGRSLIEDCRRLKIDTSALQALADAGPDGRHRTARYVAIHGADKDLIAGIADMTIFQQMDADFARRLIDNSVRPNGRLKALVLDGNLTPETFRALLQDLRAREDEFAGAGRPTVFFEPTSDVKSILPVRAQSLEYLDVIKPNLSELFAILQYTLTSPLDTSTDIQHNQQQPSSYQQRLQEFEYFGHVQRLVTDSHSHTDKIRYLQSLSEADVEVLAYALLHLMNTPVGSAGRRSVVSGKHLFVSRGAKGVLWCSVNASSTAYKSEVFPAEQVRQLSVSTNGAGDAFFAGAIASILRQSSAGEVNLPNQRVVEDGLVAARDWLLRK